MVLPWGWIIFKGICNRGFAVLCAGARNVSVKVAKGMSISSSPCCPATSSFPRGCCQALALRWRAEGRRPTQRWPPRWSGWWCRASNLLRDAERPEPKQAFRQRRSEFCLVAPILGCKSPTVDSPLFFPPMGVKPQDSDEHSGVRGGTERKGTSSAIRGRSLGRTQASSSSKAII